MAAYSLIALDLDGTLLNSDEEISEGNRRAVKHAREAGVETVIITGRSSASARGLIRDLHLSDVWVSYNGGIVQTDGGVLKSTPIHAPTVHRTVTVLKEAGYSPILYDSSDRRYFENLGSNRDHLYELALGHSRLLHQRRDLLEESWEDILRISVFITEDEIPAMERILAHHLDGHVRSTQTYFPDRKFWIYEILDVGSSKSQALQFICERESIEPERTIAVGDNRNDIDMLQWAGLGVAMKNARDEIKIHADYVTERSNDEDGVAEVIERFILSNLESSKLEPAST